MPQNKFDFSDLPDNQYDFSDLPDVTEKPGILKQGWDWLNKPLVSSGYVDLLQSIANPMAQRYAPKPMREFGNQMTSGLTSPLNLGMAAATGGESVAARYGFPAVAKGLQNVGRIASGGMMVEGAQNVLGEDKTLAERGMGLLELGGGYLGARSRPLPTVKSKPVVGGNAAIDDLLKQRIAANQPVAPTVKPRLRITPEGLKPVSPEESWANLPDKVEPIKPVEQAPVAAKYEFKDGAYQKVEPAVQEPGRNVTPPEGYKKKLAPLEELRQKQGPVQAPVVEPVVQPKAQAAPKLPPALRGAKPRYRENTLEFESDLDKAAYITAQTNPSKADASYLKFVMDHLGVDEAGARSLGRRIKASIKSLVPDENGTIRVPDSSMRKPSLVERFIKEDKGEFDPDEFKRGMKNLASKLRNMTAKSWANLPDKVEPLKPIEQAFAKTRYEFKDGAYRKVEPAVQEPVSKVASFESAVLKKTNDKLTKSMADLTPEDIEYLDSFDDFGKPLSRADRGLSSVEPTEAPKPSLAKRFIEEESGEFDWPTLKKNISEGPVGESARTFLRAVQGKVRGVLSGGDPIKPENIHANAQEFFDDLLAPLRVKTIIGDVKGSISKFEKGNYASDERVPGQVGELNKTIEEVRNYVEGLENSSASPREKYFDIIKRFYHEDFGEFNPYNVTRRIRAALKKSQATSGYTPPEQVQKPVGKLLAALDEARSLREVQGEMYKQERAERFAKVRNVTASGREGYHARLGQLKGEYEKVDPPDILKLSEQDVDSLFDTIRDNLSTTDHLHASEGLEKLLGARGMNTLPQPHELIALDKAFGNGFSKNIIELHGGLGALGKVNLFGEAVNFSKAMRASLDISAAFRQGIGQVHTGAFWKNLGEMARGLGSHEYYNDVIKSIDEKPLFQPRQIVNPTTGNVKLGKSFAQEAGLYITKIGEYADREEQYASKLASKIPGIARSERAYVGFLNKLRADSFENLIASAKLAGKDPEKDLVLARKIADYVNNTTGRGSLDFGKNLNLEDAATALNNVFFSPRLVASRIRMMNPLNYTKMDPFVRKQYWKSLIGTLALGETTLGLAKMAGARVEDDPRSSDFQKAKFGNTRLDPWGGFQQYFTLLSRLKAGEKMTSRGTVTELGQRYGAPTRRDIMVDFVAGKLNPVIAFASNWLNETKKQPFNAPDEVNNLFVPMVVEDLYEIYKEDPSLLPLGIPAAVGMGVQTYDQPTMLRDLMSKLPGYQPRNGGLNQLLPQR